MTNRVTNKQRRRGMIVLWLIIAFSWVKLSETTYFWTGVLIAVTSYVITYMIVACLLKKVPAKTFVLSRGGIGQVFPERCWYMRYHYSELEDITEDRYLFSYEQKSVTLAFSTTGEPPLLCTIIITRKGTPNAWLRMQDILQTLNEKRVKDLSSFATFIGHEFMHNHIDDLAMLYNPLDAEQQDRYYQLLSDYLKERSFGFEALHIGQGSCFKTLDVQVPQPRLSV